MKRKFFFVSLLFIVLMFGSFGLAIAQTATAIDPAIVKAIANLSFIPGGLFSVIGLTELVRRWFWPNEATRPKWTGYVVSIAISILASLAYFTIVIHPFVFVTFLIYAAVVAAGANGIYKAF